MKRTGAILFASALPSIAFAQGTTLGDILTVLRNLLDTIVPILIVLALIFFIWGVAQYIMASGDAEAQKSARNTMIWGVVALFVIVSVWGLIAVLQSTFSVGSGPFQTPDTGGTP